MSESERSPLPWKAEESKYDYAIIEADSGWTVAKVYEHRNSIYLPETDYTGEGKANADFIVKACNDHDALYRALKNVLCADRSEEASHEELEKAIKEGWEVLERVEGSGDSGRVEGQERG